MTDVRERILAAAHELALVQELPPEFVSALKLATDDELQFLAASVDDSDYPILDWLMALLEFHRYLRALAGRPARPLRAQVEYLNCCVEGANQSGGRLLSLKDLFLDYVRTYGVT